MLLRLLFQILGVMLDMVSDEGGNEEVAVIIAVLIPDSPLLTLCCYGFFQRIDFEFTFQKVVACTLHTDSHD